MSGHRGPLYKADGNAKFLDERARAHGVSIWRAERPYDRIWAIGGVTHLVEYKNPNTAYGRKGLNDVQQKIADAWRGTIYVVETVEDVDVIVAKMRKQGQAVREKNLL